MPASYCSSCGAAVTGRFCAQCGSAVASDPAMTDEPTAVDLSPLPPPPAPLAPPPLPPASPYSPPPPTGPAPVYGTIPPAPQPGAAPSAGRTAAILGGVVALVVLIAIGVLILVRGGNDDSNEAAVTTPTTTPTPTTSPAPTTPTLPPTSALPPAVAPVAPGDVYAQPAGLLCRDLETRGYSYAAAVDYWRHWGHTNQMDVDKDGIPCATVYPLTEIESYWGVSLSQPSDGPLGYPARLLCRDLSDRGASTREALLYYVLEGFPARMDADGNGIPCETVYPDATSVWQTG